ncbi:MAG: TraB domain-containing protein [archaeon]|nr:TraB domain-containing protein [archaeon]
MITIIGTGHVFNISEQIAFFIKHIWPDVVLVELDATRYNAMNIDNTEEKKNFPRMYRSVAKYQNKISKKYGVVTGNEMFAAVQTGKLIGAEIGFIDDNIVRVIKETQAEMSFGEKIRYSLSSFNTKFSTKKHAKRVTKNYYGRENEVIEILRKKYPTLIRKLFDERNEHMVTNIIDYLDRFSNVLIVVGDLHVESITKLLGRKDIRKIRLNDILNTSSLNKIKAEVWNR